MTSADKSNKKYELSNILTYFFTKNVNLKTPFTSQSFRVLSVIKFYEREKISILPMLKLRCVCKVALWNSYKKNKNNRPKHVLQGGI